MSVFIASKIYLNPTDQVRRIQIQFNTENENDSQTTTLSDFKRIVSQFYGQAHESECSILIQYLDDEEDWVSVSYESEWKEALRRFVLINHRQTDGNNAEQLLRIKCRILPKKPTISAAHQTQESSHDEEYEQDTFSSDPFALLMDKETWKPLIEQVKKGSERVQPFVEQAKDKTIENARKVQEWITDPVKKQEMKQWFYDMLDILSEESHLAQEMFGGMLREFESLIMSQVNPAPESTSSAPSSQEEEEEEQNDEMSEESDFDTEDFVIVGNDAQHVPEQVEEQVVEAPEPFDLVDEEEEEEVPESETMPIYQEDDSILYPQLTIQEEAQYSNELQNLQEMGFPNRNLNLQLLKEKNGDIVRVVAELLATSL